MHEYSIVQALMDRIGEEAARHGATGVHAARVKVGELAGVDAELLKTAWDTFREGTLCAEAPLTIDIVPARWACPSCAHRPARGAALWCGACGQPVRLAEGDELLLERVELEVP